MGENKNINTNMVKLRELTNKMSLASSDEYENVLRQLKKIVEEGKAQISLSKTPRSKVACYEKMCATITGILTKVSF